MKRLIALALSLIMVFSCLALVSCGKKKSEVQKIIDQAQTMTLEELALKAYEESNGKKFSGVGNSSRGATALPFFVEYVNEIAKKTARANTLLKQTGNSRKTTRFSKCLIPTQRSHRDSFL